MRSKWKITIFKFPIYREIFFKKFQANDYLKIWDKGNRIFFDLIGKKLNIYNGTKFISMTIKREMWGKFLGELILTRKITSEIHFKKSKSKNLKKSKKK